MKTWNHYRNKKYTHEEARKMDYELDLMHGLITELYDDDRWTDTIKATLDKIARVIHKRTAKTGA